MPKTIAVIDGNSLMHRAYHAVPPTMNAPDGTPTNAVFGFCSMLFKFIEEAQPDGIVCAFGSLYSVASVKRALRKALSGGADSVRPDER